MSNNTHPPSQNEPIIAPTTAPTTFVRIWLGRAHSARHPRCGLHHAHADPGANHSVVLAGHDVMGSAQTGTGKTASFVLPILQKSCLWPPPAPRPRAIPCAHWCCAQRANWRCRSRTMRKPTPNIRRFALPWCSAAWTSNANARRSRGVNYSSPRQPTLGSLPTQRQSLNQVQYLVLDKLTACSTWAFARFATF